MNKLVIIIIVLEGVSVFSAIFVRESAKEWPRKEMPRFKYTADQLLTAEFPKKTSDDIFLDPCKSGKLKIKITLKTNKVSTPYVNSEHFKQRKTSITKYQLFFKHDTLHNMLLYWLSRN